MHTDEFSEREAAGALLRGLAEPARLRVLAALVDASQTPGELAAILFINPAAVMRHVKKLEQAGLVVAVAGTVNRYGADFTKLQRIAVQLSAQTRVRETASVANVDSGTLDVLSAFFDGQRLKSLPVMNRKKEIVLEEFLRRIPWQDEYHERDLNRFIEEIFDDFCTVRRAWIDREYMTRDHGVYRWTERGLNAVRK